MTFLSTNAALSACKSEGIQEVFATLWGDNGTETNVFCGLLGLQLYAEHVYSQIVDMNKLKDRFNFCTKGDFDAFMSLKYLDQLSGTSNTYFEIANPSKYLLWQDILLGLFDKNIQGLDITKHYKQLYDKMRSMSLNNSEWDFVFDVFEKLCFVLTYKSDMGIRLKELYDNKDINGLKKFAKCELPELSKRINELRLAHREQWFKTYKPFGWEVLDIRYGGLLARVDSVIKRINDYLEGRVQKIEELEEERLYFDEPSSIDNAWLVNCKRYHRIVTAGAFST